MTIVDHEPIAPAGDRFEYPEWLSSQRSRHVATRAVRWIAALLAAYACATALRVQLLPIMGCLMIIWAAIYPTIRWVRRSDGTLPIFPLVALFCIPTYALQLVAVHPKVALYSAGAQFYAAVTVTLFLVAGTFAWMAASERPARAPAQIAILPWNRLVWLGLACVFVNTIFESQYHATLLPLPYQFHSLIRFTISNAGQFGGFYVAFAWGRRSLNPLQIVFFLACYVVLLFILCSEFVLASIMTYLIVALAGFGIGRGRLPLRFLALLVVALTVLNVGKGEMREYYGGGVPPVREVPERVQRWAMTGLRMVGSRLVGHSNAEESRKVGLLERSSLMHLLLLAQNRQPDAVPFLKGASYAPVPLVVVPRFLKPDKPRAHEGTHLINITFGLQTREATRTTTIGWGLLNEGYVNFGLFGVILVGAILGLFIGSIERFARHFPVNSMRFVVAIVVLRIVLNTEMSAAVFVSSLMQGIIATLAVSLISMRLARWPELPSEPAAA